MQSNRRFKTRIPQIYLWGVCQEDRFESCKSFNCLAKSKKQLNLTNNKEWQNLITSDKQLSTIKEKFFIDKNKTFIGKTVKTITEKYFKDYNKFKLVSGDEYIQINLITTMSVIEYFLNKIKGD